MWTLPFLFLTRQGRRDIEMTMHYLDVTLNDLQRTFELARSKPRHLVPQPRVPSAPLRAGLGGVNSLHNMCSRCSVARCQTALLAFASTGSPTASPKSSSKRASSRRPEHGQRLTGYVGKPEARAEQRVVQEG